MKKKEKFIKDINQAQEQAEALLDLMKKRKNKKIHENDLKKQNRQKEDKEGKDKNRNLDKNSNEVENNLIKINESTISNDTVVHQSEHDLFLSIKQFGEHVENIAKIVELSSSKNVVNKEFKTYEAKEDIKNKPVIQLEKILKENVGTVKTTVSVITEAVEENVEEKVVLQDVLIKKQDAQEMHEVVFPLENKEQKKEEALLPEWKRKILALDKTGKTSVAIAKNEKKLKQHVQILKESAEIFEKNAIDIMKKGSQKNDKKFERVEKIENRLEKYQNHNTDYMGEHLENKLDIKTEITGTEKKLDTIDKIEREEAFFIPESSDSQSHTPSSSKKNLFKSASKLLAQISGDVSIEQALWNLMAQDEIAPDKDLIQTFLAEASDLSAEISSIFRELKENNINHLIQLKRNLHTLKGNAKMIGANTLGEQFHGLETILEDLERQFKNSDADVSTIAEELEFKFIQVQKMIDWIENPPAHLIGIEEDIEDKKHNHKETKETRTEKAPNININQVRVSPIVLDNLINQASEARLAVTNIFESNGLLNGYIGDLSDGINRLAKMLRELELHTEVQMQSRRIQVEEAGKGFDPLEFDRFDRLQELTRFLAEGFGDLLDIQQDFNHVLTEQEAILYTEERTVEEIQQNLANTRLINFGQSSGRFQRIVLQTASELNKKVKLTIHGDDIELDRALLEKINTPIEHLLRNAVAHGIETPENRAKAGKNEQGLIHITLNRNEGRMFLEIKDDGHGVDLEKVRQKAIEKGLIASDAILNENQITDLIFMPGFSTAEKVSQVAGRGVGMDVVKSEVLGIGGRLDTVSKKGLGLNVLIEFPATLSSMPALLVDDSEQVWGFPVKYLEEVIYLNEEKIKHAYKNGLNYLNENIKLYYFPHLAGFLDAPVEIKNYNYVVVFKEGTSIAAIHIPTLLGTKEVQVKPLGKAFTRINGLQGAFIMPDGDVAYMVEPLRMLTDKMIKSSSLDNLKVTKKYTVLVVDDSLVIRKASSRFLIREGFDVITAKNGEEGLEVIQEKLPDLVLLDVEMPKMDGFEFTKHLREHNNPKYNSLPIIMITSRTADKHKNHALSLGVNEYLGKPYKEEDLILHINKILKK